jgi:hypothetical protein
MYKKYLRLHCTESSIPNEYYIDDSQECMICGNNTPKMFKTWIKEETIMIDACFLCNCTINFDKSKICFVMLGKSVLTQQEINNKTFQYLEDNESMPNPLHLDKKAKLINVSSYQYIKYVSDTGINQEYKIFFTNEIQKKIGVIYDYEKFNINTWKVPKKNISDDLTYSIKTHFINADLAKIQKSLNDKYNKLINKNLFMNDIITKL